MALLGFDSFAHYTTLAQKGWTVGVTGTAPTIAAEGRTASCVKWTLTGSQTAATLTYAPARPSATISGALGFAIKVTGLSNVSPLNKTLLAFMQSGVSGLTVMLNTDGTLTLRRLDPLAETDLATTSGAIVDGVWAYLGFDWALANAGSFLINLAGAGDVLTFSGDTLSSGIVLPEWQSIRFLGGILPTYGDVRSFQVGAGTTTVHVCDFYLIDKEGAYTTDLLGNVTAECLLPQTDAVDPGTNSDWTCSTGGDHGALVDENPPDDDTTYLSIDTTGKDTWNYPPMSVDAATIYGVQVSTCAKKADSGTAEFKNLARVTTVDNQGTTTHSPADTGYVYYKDVWERNPDDSTVWTPADIADAEFGVERTA